MVIVSLAVLILLLLGACLWLSGLGPVGSYDLRRDSQFDPGPRPELFVKEAGDARPAVPRQE